MIHREQYIERISAFIDQPELIKIIVGIRRCGKSVMLELIQNELIKRGANPENFISLNFEKMSLSDLRDPVKLNDYLMKRIGEISGRAYLFLDEIQEVEGWERCVNSLRASADADIYLTGSNAGLLSGEYASLIGGRYITLKMLPIIFLSIYSFRKSPIPTIFLKEASILHLRNCYVSTVD